MDGLDDYMRANGVEPLWPEYKDWMDRKIAAAISDCTTQAAPDHVGVPTLDGIARMIENPWNGMKTVPHHFAACEFAAAALAREIQKEDSLVGRYACMEIRIDKSLPLGRIEVRNADGDVLQELNLSADAIVFHDPAAPTSRSCSVSSLMP